MMIDIHATDGSGSFKAYVAHPETTDAAPVILVIQEIFGINHVMRDICEDLAGQGYIAICPDLFWRQEPGIDITDKTEAEWEKAFELYQGFSEDLGIEDLKATLEASRTLDGANGKVGTMGYCLGGKLAYLMATRSNIDAAISYYGVGIENNLTEAAEIKKPLLMHMGTKDKFVSDAARTEILDHLSNIAPIQIEIYDGCDHAFAREGGEHYDKDSATRANATSASFLKKHLR